MTIFIAVILSVWISYILFGRRDTVTWKELDKSIGEFFDSVEKTYGDNSKEIKKLKQEVFLVAEKVDTKADKRKDKNGK